MFKQYKPAFTVLGHYLCIFRMDFAVLAALSIVSAAANSFVPYFAGRIIDAIFSSTILFPGTRVAMPLVFGIMSVWFLVKIIADIIDRHIDYQSDRIGELIEDGYIVRAIERIVILPVSFHKSKKMGEVFDRMSRAGSWLSQITSRIFIDLTPQFLSIIIAFIITFSIRPVLADILLAAVCVYVVVLVRITPRLAGMQRRMHRAYNRAYGDAYDTIINIQTVKQAAAESYEARRHHRNFLDRGFSFWMAIALQWRRLTFSQKILVSITQLALFVVSVFFIRAGSMTIGQLVMFNGYAAMLFGPFVVLGRNWQAFQNGLTAITRAENILQTPPEIYTPHNVVIPKRIRGDVEFSHVSFGYGESSKAVLHDITFSVRAGETVALVGESGVGKSTLVDLISLYHRPTRGVIRIDGHDNRTLDLKRLRSAIATVPQDIVLFNDTIKNNIKYGRFGVSDDRVAEAARQAHADEFIDSFPKKYNQIVGERGIKLSVGQKQRIAIARALVRDPRILILDEPTSALDARSEHHITESLEHLMKGRTTFIIAHRLSTVRKADMILVLDKGHVVERGRHEDLIQKENGVYRELYHLQLGLS